VAARRLDPTFDGVFGHVQGELPGFDLGSILAMSSRSHEADQITIEREDVAKLSSTQPCRTVEII
jgi:hypothetical protein